MILNKTIGNMISYGKQQYKVRYRLIIDAKIEIFLKCNSIIAYNAHTYVYDMFACLCSCVFVCTIAQSILLCCWFLQKWHPKTKYYIQQHFRKSCTKLVAACNPNRFARNNDGTIGDRT